MLASHMDKQMKGEGEEGEGQNGKGGEEKTCEVFKCG